MSIPYAVIVAERSKLSSKDEHDKKLARVRGIVASAEANLRSSERDKQAALNRATGFKNKAEGVVAQIGRPCTTCGKPYCEDDLSTVKESFIGQARTEVTQAQAFSKTMAEQQTILERARETENSLASSSPDVSAITTRIEQLTRDLAGLRHRSGELSKVEAEAKKATSLVESVISEINPFLETISRHEANLLASKNKYTELKKDLKDHEKQAVLLDKARQVFSPAGVRSHILTSVTPFLNARTAEYLNTLSDGNITAEWSTMEATKKGEYRDKFNISVVKAGASKNFAGLSGGEKRKARLACCLALQDLVASRASKNIQLFIGDEIDDALDSAGLERLMGILESKARERGTVMILDCKPTDQVLEPSAGRGDLIAYLNVPQENVTCVEIAPLFCDILGAKGYNVYNKDFLNWSQEFVSATDYDKIAINPPYSEGRAKEHTLSTKTTGGDGVRNEPT